MQVSLSSKTILPQDKPPGDDLKGAKTLPPRTFIVYKSPPFGTEQGIQSPNLGT